MGRLRWAIVFEAITPRTHKEEPMPRIQTPATIEAAPQASQPLLEAIKKQLGVVPNLFRMVSTSPAALEGYLGLSGALGTEAGRPYRDRSCEIGTFPG